ncbi:hypothetical protein E2C01_045071 [Portunus trituberculatus]|uniref:Uncharacterized protein n=1 Tax=Portunus trituberculatus TaxID=210409 RepID=A0A5B7G0T8_PORTR|nr:hypothetical protein [Portunus trituberculatus]
MTSVKPAYAGQQFLALLPLLCALSRCSSHIVYRDESMVKIGTSEMVAWNSGAALQGLCEPRIAAQVLAFSHPADTLREVRGADEQGEQVAGAISEGDLGGRHGG